MKLGGGITGLEVARHLPKKTKRAGSALKHTNFVDFWQLIAKKMLISTLKVSMKNLTGYPSPL